MLDVETPKPCASPVCKTVVNRGVVQGVHCPSCNRTYCLSHRMKEDHDCKNLVPLGARPKIFDPASSAEKARSAFGKLKAWGAVQKEKAVTASRVLPKPKPSSASARLIAVNAIKKTAKGDEKVPAEKRIYIYVEAEAATTTSKFPKGAFWFSKDWVVGRVLDDAAKRLMVENVNNQSLEEVDKLRVFSVEGGRLLEFGEKLGTAVVSGNTLVLLRGVGPAVPDLITA
jgi:putative cofactor-binding repeat protein